VIIAFDSDNKIILILSYLTIFLKFHHSGVTHWRVSPGAVRLPPPSLVTPLSGAKFLRAGSARVSYATSVSVFGVVGGHVGVVDRL